MTTPGNGSRRYVVSCSGVIGKAIRRAHRQASREGRGETVSRAFRQIIRRLELDPFHAGEAAYRLPGLRMQIRTIVVRPLVVDFGVYEDGPVVVIKGIKLLSEK